MSFTPLPGSSVTLWVADPETLTYAVVNGIKESSFAPTADLQDATTFSQASSTAKNKFATLTDGTISLSGYLDTQAAGSGTPQNGQSVIRTRWANLQPMSFKIMWASGYGHSVKCYAKSVTIKSTPDGIVSFEASLEFSGQPAEVSS